MEARPHRVTLVAIISRMSAFYKTISMRISSIRVDFQWSYSNQNFEQ